MTELSLCEYETHPYIITLSSSQPVTCHRHRIIQT